MEFGWARVGLMGGVEEWVEEWVDGGLEGWARVGLDEWAKVDSVDRLRVG